MRLIQIRLSRLSWPIPSVFRALAGLLGLFFSGQVFAQASCNLTPAQLTFGSVLPNSVAVDSESSISVTCSVIGAPPGTVPFSVLVSTGQSGSFSVRRLVNGSGPLELSRQLDYNLFTSSARLVTQIWGDGTSSTVSVTGSVTGLNSFSDSKTVDLPIYGRVFAGQSIKTPGIFSDSLIVTLSF